MPDQLQLRGGTTAEHSAFTGASKEVTVDTSKKTVVVHDGTTAGGVPVMREDASNSALALGSQGAPSLKFTGDTNTGIYSPGADQLAISTNGTGRLRVSSTGTVEIVGAGTIGSTQAVSFNGSAPVNSLVIDSSGRLLVGTSSARANFYNSTNSPFIQLEGNDNDKSALAIIQDFNANTLGPQLILAKNNSQTINTNVLVALDDRLGTVSFQGNDNSQFVEAASIQAFVDGTPGADDMPGRLVFSTTADGASSPTERMRIMNNGVVTTFNSAGDSLNLYNANGAGSSYGFIYGIHSATNNISGGTISFLVYTNGNVVNTNNSYGAISDIKLKENIVDAGSQWNDLKALQVRKYNFKEETGQQTHTQIGLIAQEVELVSPGLVYESPDRDAEGNDLGTVTKSVNYSVLYMKAVKALQEAMERIEQLEAKVAALESA